MAERMVDAFILPKGFAGDGRAAWQHGKVNRTLAPLAGAKTLWFRDCTVYNFAHPVRTGRIEREDESLKYPGGHPFEKEDRYEWFLALPDDKGQYRPMGKVESPGEVPGHVLFGYLKKDESEGDPAVPRGIEERKEIAVANSQDMLRHVMETPEHYQRLRDRLGFTDQDMERNFGHLV